jgi:hypothetical protein
MSLLSWFSHTVGFGIKIGSSRFDCPPLTFKTHSKVPISALFGVRNGSKVPISALFGVKNGSKVPISALFGVKNGSKVPISALFGVKNGCASFYRRCVVPVRPSSALRMDQRSQFRPSSALRMDARLFIFGALYL